MTDRFSYQRFDLLWSYYHPAIIRQWVWTIVAVLAFFLVGVLARYIESFTLFSLINTLLALPVYLGPLVFTLYNDRAMQIQLPATAGEKATFYIFHSIIIMPVAVLAIWLSLNGIYASLWGDGEGIYGYFMVKMIESMANSGIEVMSFKLVVQRIFMELLPVAVTLYTVLSARTHRVIKGIGAAIGTLVAYGIVSGIVGFFTALTRIKTLENVPAENIDNEAVQMVTGLVSDLLFVLSLSSAVCFVLFIFLIYRKVKRMKD